MTTRGIGVRQYGGPEALQVLDLPDEAPGDGEVLIRVKATAVSPTDTMVRSGGRAGGKAPEEPGVVPGMDVAGVVLEAPGTDLEAGEAVIGIVLPQGTHGAYRREIVIPADSVVRAPAGASPAQAATLPMNGLTARRALDLLGLSAGQTLAVTGAAGTLGGYLIQLGVVDGLTVVADASEEDEKLVRSLGAQIVVRRGDDVAARIRQALPEGVDGLADASVQSGAVLPAVKDGGAVATFRGYRGDGERGITVHPVSVANMARENQALTRLRELAESGALTLRVADVLPYQQAEQAHRRLEAGGLRGRIVLDLSGL